LIGYLVTMRKRKWKAEKEIEASNDKNMDPSQKLFRCLFHLLPHFPPPLINLILEYRFSSFRGTLCQQWGSKGTGPAQFIFPRGMTTDGAKIFVSDFDIHRIQIFDTQGKFLSQWGGVGGAESQFLGPNQLALQDNKLYVTDYWNKRIQVFLLPSCQFFRSYLFQAHPVCVAFFRSLFYISFHSPHGIGVYDDKGDLIRKWRRCAGKSKLVYPCGLAAGHDAVVYVADRSNDRIALFSTEGLYQRCWREDERGEKLLDYPQGVVIEDDFLYVSDRNWIRQFDKGGRMVKRWGGLNFATQFFLLNERCYVANSEPPQIKVFQ